MYVEGDIDAQKTVNVAFIGVLLPFTNLERKDVPHSVVYHIKKILDDKEVQKERLLKWLLHIWVTAFAGRKSRTQTVQEAYGHSDGSSRISTSKDTSKAINNKLKGCDFYVQYHNTF